MSCSKILSDEKLLKKEKKFKNITDDRHFRLLWETEKLRHWKDLKLYLYLMKQAMPNLNNIRNAG